MPLQINKQKGDKTISYWRIVRLYFNVDEKHMIAELRGYENKQKSDEAATGAKTSLEDLQFSFSGTDFPDTEKANLLQKIYTLIKKSTLYGVDWSKSTEV